MEKRYLKQGIQPVRSATMQEIREMTREAGTMGEFNLGEYGHDVLTDAAAGAAGGAIATLPAGGAGAVPGAIIGGLSGLVGHGLKDLWYATRSNEDKASWQAGDIQERLNTIAGIMDKHNPTLAKYLTGIGTEIKQYVDENIQKKESSPSTDASNDVSEPTDASLSPGTSKLLANKNNKFIRIAKSPKMDNHNDFDFSDTAKGMGGALIQGDLSNRGAEQLYNVGLKGLSQAAPQISEDLMPKLAPELLSSGGGGLASGLASGGVGLLAGIATDKLLDFGNSLRGEKTNIEDNYNDINEQFKMLLQLTNNEPNIQKYYEIVQKLINYSLQSIDQTQNNVNAALQSKEVSGSSITNDFVKQNMAQEATSPEYQSALNNLMQTLQQAESLTQGPDNEYNSMY